MRVEFTSLVTLRNVDLRQVTNTGYLDVVGSLDEVRARDGAVGDDTRAVAALEAPRDLDTLRVSNHGARTRLRRREETEVIERVHCGPTAESVLRLGRCEALYACGRTVDILAHRVLVTAIAALVRARLTLLGDPWRGFRKIGGRVGLREGDRRESQRDEGSRPEHRKE